jgi:hypothetical protein
MARDIFNRVVDLGKPLAVDATRLLFPFIGEEDMLLQNVNISYQQNITRLWEVGSTKTYFFAGRTQGTIQAKRIIGTRNAALGFVKQYGDVCNMQKNHITLQLEAGCEGGSDKGSIKASGVVINSVAYAISTADMIINEEISMMFARLEGG